MATVELEDVHIGGLPPRQPAAEQGPAVVPSLYIAVAVTVVVSPTANVDADALTVRLVAVTPDTVTVMTAEALCPPTVAVMVAVPATSTLATDELLDSHDAFTLALVPSL